jgi:hypothetical protein
MSTLPVSLPWWRTLTREHWFVFSIASLAWLFDCMDQQFFNLARDAAMEQLLGPQGDCFSDRWGTASVEPAS